MVWFTVRDQGGSAGVRCRCLVQQCSGAWPVLCVCTNKLSALQKSYVRAECNSEAEKYVGRGQRKKFHFWKGIGGQTSGPAHLTQHRHALELQFSSECCLLTKEKLQPFWLWEWGRRRWELWGAEFYKGMWTCSRPSYSFPKWVGAQ